MMIKAVSKNQINFIVAMIFFIVALAVIFGIIFLREKARRINCGSCLKSIGLALEMYSHDYRGEFPHKSGAAGLEMLRSLDYVTDYKIYVCPASKTVPGIGIAPLTEKNVSYYYRGGLSKKDSADSPIMWDKSGNHGSYRNVLYGDGSVRGVTGKDLSKKSGKLFNLEWFF